MKLWQLMFIVFTIAYFGFKTVEGLPRFNERLEVLKLAQGGH